MAPGISIAELLAYSNEQRAVWEKWFAEHPEALPAAWDLLEHVFLVERRHAERLGGASQLTQESGIARGDGAALFAFGRAARERLAAVAGAMTAEDAALRMEITLRSGQAYTMSRRKLLLHALFHEIRHLAQVAAAVRNAGFAPPGGHDLFLSRALE